MRILRAVVVTTVLAGIAAGAYFLAALFDEDKEERDFDRED
jgi:predicted secreted protein